LLDHINGEAVTTIGDGVHRRLIAQQPESRVSVTASFALQQSSLSECRFASVEERVVSITHFIAAAERVSVRRIEGSTHPIPLRQIRVGDERATECNRVRMTMLDHFCGRDGRKASGGVKQKKGSEISSHQSQSQRKAGDHHV
jgi:hypothetical protein